MLLEGRVRENEPDLFEFGRGHRFYNGRYMVDDLCIQVHLPKAIAFGEVNVPDKI